MKRIFEIETKDALSVKKEELLNIIKHSEARTLMAETVISCEPLSEAASNPEMAASFGADMITLNTFDLTEPYIEGQYPIDFEFDTLSEMHQKHADFIKRKAATKQCVLDLKKVTGRFIGCNLEPVPEDLVYPEGYKLTAKNVEAAVELGLDYIVITGNPNTNITEEGIVEAIKVAVKHSSGKLIIIAGKMHGSGTGNSTSTDPIVKYCEAGADIIMFPAPYTTPKMTPDAAKEIVDCAHAQGKMALAAMGTSQEGADRAVVEQIALNSKVSGADIIHIGDAGFSGMADPENIKYCSIAIRGKRHTYARIGLRR